ncbi:hypothetical protein V5O48_010477 [Marasmius crinis-equi]|uniref:Transmembrane protein n=1 Tax=Marasmius crinis-equi TaxID=585013 RepID=A0ABR3F8B3_9AGAR
MAPPSSSNSEKPPKKLYPCSLILISIWAVSVALMIWWLERVVRHTPEEVQIDPLAYFGASPLVWIKRWAIVMRLPTVLLTVFAQAHGPITAMHLARIAVSALSRRSSAPNSWMELFWLADGEWEGPMGIAKTAWATRWWGSSKDSRTSSPPPPPPAPKDPPIPRVSFTFVLFATTSAVALITPVLLSQAYRIENTYIRYPYRGWVLDAVSFDKMQHIDGSDQMSMGIKSWEYDNIGALLMDYGLFYTPVDVEARRRERFRAGNIGNGTIPNLQGLHLNLSCAPVPSLDIGNLNTSWTTFCQSHISQFHGLPPSMRKGVTNLTDELGAPVLAEFSLYLCNNRTNAHPFHGGAQSRNTGYAYYEVLTDRNNATGLFQCNTTLTTGTVTAYGSNQTFTNFTPWCILNSSDATEPILDPLFAVFDSLGKAEVDPADTIFKGVYQDNRSINPDFAKYISNCVASSLTDAIFIFTSALARLSRDTVLYSGYVPVPLGLYTRHDKFAYCAYALLVLWAVLIVVLMIRSYRRTFSGSLGSYVAAELAFWHRPLLEDLTALGDPDDNKGKLVEEFKYPQEGGGAD